MEPQKPDHRARLDQAAFDRSAGDVDGVAAAEAIVQAGSGQTDFFAGDSAQLRHSLTLLEATLEATVIGFLAVDRKGNILTFNSEFVEQWRIPEELIRCRDRVALLSHASAQLKKPEELLKAVEQLEAFSDTGSCGTFACKDGRFIEWHSQPQRLDGRVIGRVWNFQDVTPRKRAEEGLRWRTALFEAQVESSLDGVLVVDSDGRKILQNRRMSELWKIPADIAADPDDKRQVEFVSSRTRNPKEFVEKIVHLYAHTNEVSRDEIELVDGTVLDRYSSPVHDAHGRYYGRIWTFHDITERRKREAERLRSQRLESIGTLASGIAHDLNNVLTPIMMAVELLKESRKSNDDRAMIETLETCVKRGAGIVQQVLSFARGSEGARIDVNPKHLIGEMARMARETFPKSIEIRTDFCRQPWLVHGDPTQLQQVLMNLCVNARDAMPAGGVLSLTVENVMVDEAEARLHSKSKPGRYIALKVTDTGTGIPAEIYDKIFEPFFTTKPVGHGTGLGLPTALSIVESHGGFIQVRSEPGVGTEFKMHLPASDVKGASPVTPAPAAPDGNGELILLVDDELSVRELLRAALQAHGYRVIAAASGGQALAQFRNLHGEIQLALVDLMMPDMDGKEVIRELLGISPGLKVIAISGMASDKDTLKSDIPGLEVILPKPFATQEFLEAVANLIRGK